MAALFTNYSVTWEQYIVFLKVCGATCTAQLHNAICTLRGTQTALENKHKQTQDLNDVVESSCPFCDLHQQCNPLICTCLLQVTGRKSSISFVIKSLLDEGNEDKEEKAKKAEKQGRHHISIWRSGYFQPKTLQYLQHIVFFVNFPLFQGQTPGEKICYQEDYKQLGWWRSSQLAPCQNKIKSIKPPIQLYYKLHSKAKMKTVSHMKNAC